MDKKQFTTQVLEAEKSLYHIAKSILGNDDDCADAIQNAVLHAFEKLHTLRNEKYFKTWLTRILINECNYMIRSRKDQVSYEDYYDTRTMAQEEDYSEVFEVVMGLEDNYRVPFVLFYVEGFSVKEICQILKLSQGTVKTRLYRSRKLLKEKLMGVYGYAE
ncbi:RNA polymerase sigma factor [Parablautia muri]|uniref:Sigma-70 family RNA polymerase sigma factor n=1 Tax=Parablautia muri TaxID=2320879 RepID=A0A9X5BJ02_9FIRM|nr:sigma-70 family RNA polymerase sigma factor [Parablautia muri]NBJ94653.1 sigma-70 family RNA polymerase sigma factor [Parablautia muri]